MIVKSLRRAAIALGAAVAAVAMFAVATPSSASADALRPLNVSLTCSGTLPYGYSLNVGSGWYEPVAASDATLVGNVKTFHFLIPTTASYFGMNTWCGGYQTATWQGNYYDITPGTSSVNAGGYAGMYDTYQQYTNYHLWYTYVVISSISYS